MRTPLSFSSGARIQRGVITFVLLTAACLDYSLAQTAEPTNSTAQDKDTRLEEVLVTARKREERLQDVPVAVTAISADQLSQRNIEALIDIQATTPGFRRSYLATGGSSAPLFFIRGLGPQEILPNTDSPVGLYVDGVNFPRPFGANVPMFDVERVEVLKGPQGTLYGTSTTAGAINIVTKNPGYDFGGHAGAQVGNFGFWNINGAVDLPLVRDKLAVRLSADRRKNDGYAEEQLTGRDIYVTDETVFRGKLLWEPSDGVKLLLAADYSRNHDDAPIAKGRRILPNSPIEFEDLVERGLPFTTENLQASFDRIAAEARDSSRDESYNNFPQFGEFIGKGASLTAALDFNDRVSLKSITSYRNWDREFGQDSDDSSVNLFQTYYHGDDENITQEFVVTGTNFLNGKLSWTAGYFYNREDALDWTSNTSFLLLVPAINPQIFEGDLKNQSHGVYAQGTYALTNRLNLTAGVRPSWSKRELTSTNRFRTGAQLAPWNVGAIGGITVCNISAADRSDPAVCKAHWEDKFDNTSYTASLDFHITPDVMTYLSTARGYLAGGRNIRGNATPGSFAPFDPEKATNYEIGLKGDLLDRQLMVNLALWYLDYKDIQRTVQTVIDGVATSLALNAASATLKGVEAEVTYRPFQRVAFTLTTAYTDAKYDSFDDPVSGDRSDEPFQVPEWTVGLSLDASHALSWGDEVRTHFDWYWQDDLTFSNVSPVLEGELPSMSQDSFALLNGRLSYVFERSNTEVALWGRNLTDKDYFTFAIRLGECCGIDQAYMGEPRTYGVEITQRF
ncbi:MAG: TonB-dependent receptor [Steroidobacteraceae bacterium]